MFYIIYIAVIVFALYLIFHDRPEGDGERRREQKRPTSTYRPENPGRVPQVPLEPESPMPKPLEPARPIEPERPAQRAFPADPVRPVVRPVTPVEPAKPVRTFDPFRPAVPERELSWEYLDALEYDEDIDGDTVETEVTGMRYYCTLADLGPVNGYVQPEPDNPHDPDAQVVVRADGKKLGYIPKNALEEYLEFNPEGLTCPFAGYVKVTRQGYLWAEILVALPESREFVESELTDYLESGQPEG